MYYKHIAKTIITLAHWVLKLWKSCQGWLVFELEQVFYCLGAQLFSGHLSRRSGYFSRPVKYLRLFLTKNVTSERCTATPVVSFEVILFRYNGPREAASCS
uniref:Secreted protein n=1 Tax=Ixodes ricinus TaxID=34613 RepID=A0A6B0U6Q1_IXORI